MSSELQSLVSKYGVKFIGGFATDNDKIHPKDISSISVGL